MHPFTGGSKEKRVPLLVLELDGVVRLSEKELGKPIRLLEDVQVHEHAVARIKEWKLGAQGRVICLSNQPDIALNLLTTDALGTLMKRTHDLTGALIDQFAVCVHHPDAPDPEMARCWCRLPSPGLLVEVVMPMTRRYGEMYPPHLGLFVGATVEFEQAAKLAGFPFMPASRWHRGQ